MRKTRALLAVILAAIFTLGVLPAGAQDGVDKIVVGLNAEYPPFESVDEDGNIIGFDPDLMAAISAEMGFEVEWVNTRWDGIFAALASGEFDAVMSAATITAEREETVDFTAPYFVSGIGLAIRQEDAETITGEADLPGLRVAVQSGTTADIGLSEVDGVEVVRYDEAPLAFQALSSGDVDVAAADAATSAEFVANNPDAGLMMLEGLLSEEFFGIAVHPEKPEVLDVLNEGLSRVIASGEYEEIYTSWFEGDVPLMFRSFNFGEPIVIGINPGFPPFESVDEDGNIIGLDPDLMAAMAEEMGFEYEWVEAPWDGIFPALAAGEFDAVMSGATITEAREEIVDFTDPYFLAGQMVVVRQDDADTITGQEDLPGLRVGVQAGSSGEAAAEKIDGVEVVRYPEIAMAFQELGTGDSIDAILQDRDTAAAFIASNPDLNLTLVGDLVTTEYYGIAVNPERPDVLDLFNAGIKRLIESGTYAEIYAEWFETDMPEMFAPTR
jgi:ABC-type amino acid transport substrate-binding protein